MLTRDESIAEVGAIQERCRLQDRQPLASEAKRLLKLDQIISGDESRALELLADLERRVAAADNVEVSP